MFNAFTSVYATKCDPSVAGPAASMLKDMYLGSTKLQALSLIHISEPTRPY